MQGIDFISRLYVGQVLVQSSELASQACSELRKQKGKKIPPHLADFQRVSDTQEGRAAQDAVCKLIATIHLNQQRIFDRPCMTKDQNTTNTENERHGVCTTMPQHVGCRLLAPPRQLF